MNPSDRRPRRAFGLVTAGEVKALLERGALRAVTSGRHRTLMGAYRAGIIAASTPAARRHTRRRQGRTP